MANHDSAGHSHDLVYPVAVVGTLCVIGGFLSLLIDRSPTIIHFAALAVCVGFGLILAASGSRVGRWGVWAVSGAGALAIILFLLLESYLKPGVVKTGQIKGDFSNVIDVRIVDDHPLLNIMIQLVHHINI
jgi:hypothetical protein